MKAVVAAFNQEKALVGAFSVIVQPVVDPMEHYTALHKAYTHFNIRDYEQLGRYWCETLVDVCDPRRGSAPASS